MGNGAPGREIRAASLDFLQDIEMIQHIFHCAVVWQAIEQRANRVFSLHVCPGALWPEYNS
jgi:hypothetical protein